MLRGVSLVFDVHTYIEKRPEEGKYSQTRLLGALHCVCAVRRSFVILAITDTLRASMHRPESSLRLSSVPGRPRVA